MFCELTSSVSDARVDADLGREDLAAFTDGLGLGGGESTEGSGDLDSSSKTFSRSARESDCLFSSSSSVSSLCNELDKSRQELV